MVDYVLLEEINRGSFGVVYKARDKATGEIVAIKEELRGLSDSTKMEIKILDSLEPHPNIVEFKKVVLDGNDIFVVMEHVESDLEKLREELGKPFPPKLIKTLIFETLKGVAFLHENGVVHRDLKPANVLYGGEGRVKICDFGLSARVGSLWGRGVGTRWYRAPETLVGWEGCTDKVDIWSVGCMMAEFVLDAPLFQGRSDDHQLECTREGLWGRSSVKGVAILSDTRLGELGFDLLKRLLAFYPWERISARDALAHPWFTKE